MSMKTLEKLRIPLIQGGMGIGISLSGLAGAVAACGGMGVISTANIGFREPDFYDNPKEANKRALRAEIRRAFEIAGGNGMICVNAMVATSDYEDAVKVACEEGVDAIISGAGLPLRLPELTAGYDVLLGPVVSGAKACSTIMKIWERHSGRKPDFFVAEGQGAGGHLGFSHEDIFYDKCGKDIFDITEEVCKAAKDIPVFSAGSIFDRKDIEKAKALGAYGAQIGTRFIATYECDASQEYKDVILKAEEKDLVCFASPVGMPARGLKTPLIEKVMEGERTEPEKCIGCIRTCRPDETPYCITRALIDACLGKYKTGLFFAGSNVGRINEMKTVKELILELFGDDMESI